MFIIKPYIRRQLLIAGCVNVAHVLIGYTMSWSSPIIPKLQDPNQTPMRNVITVKEASWLAAAFNLCVVTGPYVAGPLSNKIGRKYSFLIGQTLALVANCLITFANSYAMILAGRLLVGLGLGMVAVTDFVYIGEMASPNIRGMLLASTGVFHSLGMVIMYILGPFCSYRTIGSVCICLSISHLFGCTFLPESQMYYIIKGQKEEARAVLKHVRNGEVDTELDSIIAIVKDSKENEASYKQIFTEKSNRKAFGIIVAEFIFQECSGILAVMYYTTTIFQLAQSSIDPGIATIVVGLTQFMATLIVPGFVEKLGRKMLLLISTSGCGICMALLGVYFFLHNLDSIALKSVGWLPLLLVILFNCCFGVGLNIIPNTLLGEMFQPNVRTRGAALSISIGWFGGFVSVIIFGYLVEAVGSYVLFFAFAVINCIAFIFTYIAVPETKGLTLAAIERMLAK